ncbi:hypothetical protein SAMN02927916_4317 [Flavobacterium anhuiense]|uniref:Yip1 domain-containing protein n=1 Tax=Flavobacterium anhuiense TaxID=459526 RepID=A0ABY0M330_9FLAO|nr:hypothetical protein [Flavobacterium anhuiense]SCY95643.1 hypothetical protein SAMN02927916_4317 [Flavobacterium anhuiense]
MIMKHYLLKLFTLSIAFIIINEITSNLLNFNGLLRYFMSDYLTLQEINRYFEFQKKWHWLTYFYIPIILLIKTSIIATILYVGLFLNSQDLKFKQIWNIALNADFIFLLVPIIKTLWFLFFQPGYNLIDVQNFYPLSALNIVGYKNLETWFIYPFQVLNLFELSYIIYLAYQIGKITSTNADYGLKIVGLSYIPSLALWVATVMFFTLNYS